MSSLSLLPRNSTALERALEAGLSRFADIPTPQRTLWDPDTCPKALLPWLAFGLSIDSWDAGWPEHIQRSVIRAAIAIARRKGTAYSVRSIVAAYGGAVVLREWWQLSPPGPPHTFELILTLQGAGGETASSDYVDAVIAEVARTKPARSHFTFTQGLQAAARIGVVAGGRVTVYRRLEMQAPTEDVAE